jgi:hypothetical protein
MNISLAILLSTSSTLLCAVSAKQRRSAKQKTTEAEDGAAVEEGGGAGGQGANKGCWITTTPTGEKLCHRVEGDMIPVKDSMITTATDPYTGQVGAWGRGGGGIPK